ncbi:Arylsulfatase precursor [Roseimaritima multifibrata]|uniref:Arylsulfatase n=1 Tax=Roseimaritima multifibrata TaxID=1930274 RepID=A0A517M9C7_9BACT|nr:sulfatase-like hydrolase/transferase [Roseimaritima multifibrata]QDS91474.1 Arylsulfatase precursor [Roseimaritima multifibrata]
MEKHSRQGTWQLTRFLTALRFRPSSGRLWSSPSGLFAFCLCAAAIGLPQITQAKEKSSRPNVLFIFADDIGYEAIQSYGGLDFQTPNLNRMANEGLRFGRAYTSPVCTPSRVSMHTSLYTTRHRHYGVLPVHKGTKQKVDFSKMPTYAQLLRANGYATSVTGKWQLATLEAWPNHIHDAGFDSWCVWQIWRDGKKTGRHWQPTFNQDGEIRSDIQDRFGPDVLADYVIDQMTTATAAGQPFFILHNELLPHNPIIKTPDDKANGSNGSLGNMIHYMDKLVGKVLRSVDDLGIRDNTYVIFMGDNGTEQRDFHNPRFGDNSAELKNTRHTTAGNVNGGKANLGDAGSHVPLIVWGPERVPQGQVCDDLIDVVDLFPTFCELSGTSIPKTVKIDGRSFLAQMHGKEGNPREWTHQGLYGKENLFDGSWRLWRKQGSLWDARNLPAETPANPDDSEAAAARIRLNKVFDQITPRAE